MKREGEADSLPSREPDAVLDLTTLRSSYDPEIMTQGEIKSWMLNR